MFLPELVGAVFRHSFGRAEALTWARDALIFTELNLLRGRCAHLKSWSTAKYWWSSSV